MSGPSTTPSAPQWTLDDFQSTADVCEDDQQVTKVRGHIVIQISLQVLVTGNSTDLGTAVGTTMQAITFNVGNITRTCNVANIIGPNGSAGKFVCVGDGFAPIEKPGEYVIRRQTWEYFGFWKPAPPEWIQTPP